jgi:hypothetical protein
MKAILFSFPFIHLRLSAFTSVSLRPRRANVSGGLTGCKPLFETRSPLLRILCGRGELDAGGAAASGKIQPFPVEPDRSPNRPQGRPPRKARERGRAQHVRFREELFLRPAQRRLAFARGEDLGHREGSGAAEAPVEMHVLDPEAEEAEIGKAGIEASFGIALQIPDLSLRRGASFDPTAERHARLVERVAAFMGPGQQERGARVARKVPRMARQPRHEEQGRAVEIAGDPKERGEGRASLGLESGQRARAGETHQPFDVGDGRGLRLFGIDGGVRHGDLDASNNLVPNAGHACNVMVILHNSFDVPSGIGRRGGLPFSEHIRSINGLHFEPASPRGVSKSRRELHAHNRAGR